MSEKKEGDPTVQFSVRLAKALAEKVKSHNTSCLKNKVSLCQVSKVYEHGVKSFDLHKNIDINTWSIGRVNMYLRMKCGMISTGDLKKKSDPQKPVSSLTFEKTLTKRVNTFIDATTNWYPSEKDIALAREDVEKHELNLNFRSIDDIYLPSTGKPLEAFTIYYDR